MGLIWSQNYQVANQLDFLTFFAWHVALLMTIPFQDAKHQLPIKLCLNFVLGE